MLLRREGMLLLVSWIVCFQTCSTTTSIRLATTDLTGPRRRLLNCTCILTLITVQWLPVLRGLPWPMPWISPARQPALREAMSFDFVPMNLLYLTLDVPVHIVN